MCLVAFSEGVIEHKENLVDLPRFGLSCLLSFFFFYFEDINGSVEGC